MNLITIVLTVTLLALTIIMSAINAKYKLISSVERVLYTELSEDFFSNKLKKKHGDVSSVQFFVKQFNEHYKISNELLSLVHVDKVSLKSPRDSTVSDLFDGTAVIYKNDEPREFPVSIQYSINPYFLMIMVLIYLWFSYYLARFMFRSCNK